jgi:hypothetical protein
MHQGTVRQAAQDRVPHENGKFPAREEVDGHDPEGDDELENQPQQRRRQAALKARPPEQPRGDGLAIRIGVAPLRPKKTKASIKSSAPTTSAP